MDSLLQLVNSSQSDLQVVSLAYSKLAKEIVYNSPDSARSFAEKGLELADEEQFSEGIVKNLIQLGAAYIELDSIAKSYEYYKRSLALINEEIPIDDKLIVYSELGFIEEIRLNLVESLSYYYEGLKLAEEIGDDHWLGIYKNNMGLSYFNQKEYHKALKLYKEAAGHFDKSNKGKSYGNAIMNTGAAYSMLGQVDSALITLKQAVQVNLEYDNIYGVLNAYASLGTIYMEKEDYDQALYYFKKSNELLVSNTDRRDAMSFQLSRSYRRLGEVYYYQNNFDEAIDYYLKAISIAEENDYKSLLNSCYFLLSNTYRAMGDYSKALDYYEKYHKLDLDFKKIENQDNIREIEAEYELEKERIRHQSELERIVAERSRHKLRNTIALLIIASISVVFLLLYYLQRIRARESILKSKNIELEKDRLQRQLEFKKKELTTNVMYLLNKNNFIVSLAKKLGLMEVDEAGENRRILGRIISDIEENVEKESWREFEIRFQEVHGEFYENLTKDFPDLSPNELKLCAFLRLNMTSKDISALTYQSPESIKVARHRLRKKLGLKTQENLIAYLNTL